MNPYFLILLMLTALPVKAASINTDYSLNAGDTIKIVVYDEPELSINNLYIDEVGQVDYPYLGRLRVTGKTLDGLRQEIYRGLKGDYLIEPKVMVTIVSFRKIFINGEVKSPGGYPYQPNLTVDKAIALAGGFTDRAARRKITVKPENSQQELSKVPLNHGVSPGDIIEVGQSFF